jgi:hydrogen peroxide-dependent heme synthase
MKSDRPSEASSAEIDPHSAPLTLEGFSVLHQMFRLRRADWRMLDEAGRRGALDEAARGFDEMARREDGESAIFAGLGHKGDLFAVHFRRSFDDLNAAQTAVARMKLSDFLEPTSSYLSVIEIGLYEASVRRYAQLAEQGIAPHSPEWREAVSAEVARQGEKIAPRLFPRFPQRRYLCFYPMDKKREGADNWYRLPVGERQRLMHAHGMVGRRFAGEVTQIISGSIGFDDWEWGVDLFADDPLVFKKLVYEMRFDEASAAYAKFGRFYVGIRIAPADLAKLFAI